MKYKKIVLVVPALLFCFYFALSAEVDYFKKCQRQVARLIKKTLSDDGFPKARKFIQSRNFPGDNQECKKLTEEEIEMIRFNMLSAAVGFLDIEDFLNK